MGISSSRSVLENTVKVMTEASTEIFNDSVANLTQSQVIRVVGSEVCPPGKECNVKIIGNKQILQAKIDMNAMMDAIATSDAQSKMINNLNQEAKAMVEGLNLGQAANASTLIKNYLEETTRAMMLVRQTCKGSSTQSQVIDVQYVNGNVIITDNLQQAVGNLYQSCMQNVLANSTAVSDLQNFIDQRAEAESKGLSGTSLIILLVIAAVIVVAGIAVPLAIGASSIMSNLFMILAIGLIIAGIVFMVMYFQSGSTETKADVYSTTINESKSQCEAKILTQSTNIYSPEDAAEACRAHPSCKAFDWIGFETRVGAPELVPREPPLSIFYSEAKPFCESERNRSTSAQPNFVKQRVWTHGPAPPGPSAGIKEGTVYIDTSSGAYYVYSLQNGWGAPIETDMPIIPSGKGLTLSDVAPKKGTIGGDYLLYYGNPSLLTMYMKTQDSGAYVPLDAVIRGPGFLIDVPEHANTSGFEVTQREDWMLTVSIICLVTGTLVFIVSAVTGGKGGKKPQAPEATK